MRDLTLFIDLDDTLYPADSGVWQDIRDRIDLYLQDVLGIPHADVPRLRHELFTTYGTTLRGLEATMHVDTADYLRFVHDVPLARYISPNPELRQVLTTYQMPKFIFTNGDRPHALRVLEILGLLDIFDGIIDITMLSPYCKPMGEAFDIALEVAGNPQPHDCVVIDDSPRNLLAAHNRNFRTILVGSADPALPFAPAIAKLADLPNVFPNNGRGKAGKNP